MIATTKAPKIPFGNVSDPFGHDIDKYLHLSLCELTTPLVLAIPDFQDAVVHLSDRTECHPTCD